MRECHRGAVLRECLTARGPALGELSSMWANLTRSMNLGELPAKSCQNNLQEKQKQLAVERKIVFAWCMSQQEESGNVGGGDRCHVDVACTAMREE